MARSFFIYKKYMSDVYHQQKIGYFGQMLAKKYLISKNYTIIAENYRIRGGEIDLIVKKKSKIGFVEVKTRTSGGLLDPLLAVNAHKMGSLRRAAEAYLREKRIMGDTEFFMSAISIVLDRQNKKAYLKFFEDIDHC